LRQCPNLSGKKTTLLRKSLPQLGQIGRLSKTYPVSSGG
jgi:hypothetical protein